MSAPLNSVLAATSLHSAAKLRQAYGISRNELHSALINNFYLHHSLQQLCPTYYLEHMTGHKFAASSHEGLLENHNGKKFVILYQDCNNYTAKRAHELRVSFREAIAPYRLPAYVIIRIQPQGV